MLSSLLVSAALSLPACRELPPAVAVLPTSAPVDPAGDAAVLIGIADYALLPDVPGAADSVRDWQQWLTGTGKLSPSRVKVLTDGRSTDRDTILAAIDAAAASVDADHRLWVVFIGLATSQSVTGVHTVLTVNTMATEDSVARNGITMLTLVEQALKTRGHAVVVVDDESPPYREHDGRPEQPVACAPPPPKLRADPRLLYIGTGVGSAVTRYNRPPVSSLVLGALRGWADSDVDGVVTLAEAQRWVGTALTAVAKPGTQGTTLQVLGNGASELARCGGETAPTTTRLRATLVNPDAELE